MILNDPDPGVCIAAADARDAMNREWLRRGGTLCCQCGIRLTTGDICPHHEGD